MDVNYAPKPPERASSALSSNRTHFIHTLNRRYRRDRAEIACDPESQYRRS